MRGRRCMLRRCRMGMVRVSAVRALLASGSRIREGDDQCDGGHHQRQGRERKHARRAPRAVARGLGSGRAG